jgi:acetyl esterase/lipase
MTARELIPERPGGKSVRPSPAVARDLLMSDSARLSTVLRRAGVVASPHLWEGMWHVFEYTPGIPKAG